MKKEALLQLASYWTEKDKTATAMERGALLAEIERYIGAHNTCALATGTGNFVRCTPIEYNYKDGCFFLFTEGGQKFFALAENANVSLAIFDPYEGFGSTYGMQVTGRAEILDDWSAPYLELLAFKGIRPEALKKLPNTLHLIKIVPQRIDFLSAGLKKQGVSTRQHIEFPG